MRRDKRGVPPIAAVGLNALLAIIFISWISVGVSKAEGLSGFLEFEYSKGESDLAPAEGPSSQTESDNFSQLYNLTLQKKIYPHLNFLASGIFQKRDSSLDVEGSKTDTTTTTLYPYVNLNLRTPLYFGEVAYSRREEKVKSSGSSPFTTVRDLFISTVYWKPDRFPDLKLQYSWDHLFDKDRLTQDTVTNQYRVTSNYMPLKNLTLNYRGKLTDTDIQLEGTKTKEITHNGRVNYFNRWWRQRIRFGLDYNYTRQDIEIDTSGTGEVGFPVFPVSGLSALGDIPEDIVLVSNPALIDGNLEASAGVNLGLPSPGGDDRRHLGLDFAVETEVNRLYVWVDRDVAQVADAFSWQIYTSADNQNWVLRQIVSPAIYSSTFNRFEIRFANLNARYIKVVTEPLSPSIPSASTYPIIFVTELQAEIRRPASEVAEEQTSTFQIGNLDFRALLMEDFALTYEFSYYFTKSDPGDLVYMVTNGLSFFRQFSKVLSGRGRVAFENGEEQIGSRKALKFTVSFTAVPYHTLYHSLVISGKDETIAGQNSKNASFLLYNTAKLYEGIDLSIGGGINFQEEGTGRRLRSTRLNAGVTLVPNKKVNLTLFYLGTTTVTSGGGLSGEQTDYTRSGGVNLSVTPVRTVYLFGSYRIEKRAGDPIRNVLNFTGNWSPFPDGTLRFNLYYNEEFRSGGQNQRSIIPSVRWYFTPRSYVNVSYENLKTETPSFTNTSDVYTSSVRISF